MGESGQMPERFEQLVLPHLDAAYNLARWLVGNPADAEDIIALCRKELAAYKVPRAVQFVSDLPKTSTGKIMRRELRKLDA